MRSKSSVLLRRPAADVATDRHCCKRAAAAGDAAAAAAAGRMRCKATGQQLRLHTSMLLFSMLLLSSAPPQALNQRAAQRPVSATAELQDRACIAMLLYQCVIADGNTRKRANELEQLAALSWIFWCRPLFHFRSNLLLDLTVHLDRMSDP